MGEMRQIGLNKVFTTEPLSECTNAETLCMYCNKLLMGRREKERLTEECIEKGLCQVAHLLKHVRVSNPLSNLGPVYGSQISDKEPAKLVVS